MMKRKILAVTIPVVGCLTVVGSGFSAWYFSDNIVDDGNGSSKVSVVVTDEVKASQGKLTIDTSETVLGTHLILDQGGPKNYSLDSGIMFGEETANETTVNSAAKWKFTVKFTGTGDQKLTLDKIYDAGLRVKIVADITLGGALSNYIEFQDNLKFTQPTGGSTTADINKTAEKLEIVYIVAEKDATKDTSATWTFELGAATNKAESAEVDYEGYDYKNDLLKYKESSGAKGDDTEENPTGKPNATGEPEKMESALGGAIITFNVTACIEDDPEK